MEIRSYINGEWLTPDSGRIVKNVNPADLGETVCEFASAGEKETLEAIAAAQNAFPGWAAVPAPERGRYVARVAALARERQDEIAGVMTREEGKLLKESLGEIKKGNSVLEYYGGSGFRIDGKTIPSELGECFTCTIRRPLGSVGIISPWNFPWAIPCWKIAPAQEDSSTCSVPRGNPRTWRSWWTPWPRRSALPGTRNGSATPSSWRRGWTPPRRGKSPRRWRTT